ncbi:response regulator transcription factor [Polaribacter cellanae]|uniref:response regulator transcription factor n=1 Tax=Polaribacter cellanae TaxID=2818493 RepID=UPI001FB6EFCA|nr:LuxR C-terminal-related transcriptional regulator [Polaribacter cellanae]
MKLENSLKNCKKNTHTEDIIKNANLSYREEEVLQLLVDNKTNKEIAEALFISVNTVKYHVKNIYDKLNIKSRREAQNIAISL